MSGHSKWANIKRKKEANDQQKGKIFSKLSRLITLAVLEGGGIPSPEKNVKLRLIVEKAKSQNMPKENINRAIERATSSDGSSLKEMVYEAFAPGGVSLIIVATTDNPNRTFNEIRSNLEKKGGKVGSPGSAIFNFVKCAQVILDANKVPEETFMKLAEDLGAFDVEREEDEYYMYIPFEKMGHIHETTTIEVQQVEQYYLPNNSIMIYDKEEIESLMLLIEVIEDLDDVQKVYANFETE